MDNSVVLITGVSTGIGLATAIHLAEKGYKVYGTIRTSSNKTDLETALKDTNSKLHLLTMDVTDESSVNRVVREVIEKENRIDILINNAGAILIGALEDCTLQETRKLFEVNVFGVMNVIQKVLPYMRKLKRGKIINISSGAGFRPRPALSLYSASKFALEGMSEALALEVEPWNIKVSLVEPGPVITNANATAARASTLMSEKNPYYKRFKKAGIIFEESSLSSGQDAVEVARVIGDVVCSSVTHLRYQTSECVRSRAADRFLDPTGEKGLKELRDSIFSKI